MTRPRRRELAWLLAVWSLLGFLLLATTVQAHGHGHRRARMTDAEAAPSTHVDRAASADAEHGHHHSGDPLKDLLTLGHTHVGGAFPGLPPTLWSLAIAPHASQPVMLRPERPLGDSPPDTPFRPPIA